MTSVFNQAFKACIGFIDKPLYAENDNQISEIKKYGFDYSNKKKSSV